MSNKRNTEQFIQKAKDIHGDLYSYDNSFYVDAKTKVEIICKEHNSFWQIPDSHLRGQGCKQCGYNTKSIDNFVLDARLIHGDSYNYDKVVYVNTKTKVEIVCPKHGTFWQIPRNHISGMQGCPNCNSSKGEIVIRNFLLDNNVVFAEQYTNPTCKDKVKLRFDFYLFDYNLLIEFHGTQHYYFVPKFHKTIDKFAEYQKRDLIKKNWAIDNGFQYLEIKYNQLQDIESLLSDALKLN